jgi:hypothetical protein
MTQRPKFSRLMPAAAAGMLLWTLNCGDVRGQEFEPIEVNLDANGVLTVTYPSREDAYYLLVQSETLDDDRIFFNQPFVLHQQGDRSFVFWMKPDPPVDQSERVILFSRPDAPPWNENRFNLWTTANGQLSMNYSSLSGVLHLNNFYAPFTPGVWSHVASTFSVVESVLPAGLTE